MPYSGMRHDRQEPDDAGDAMARHALRRIRFLRDELARPDVEAASRLRDACALELADLEARFRPGPRLV